MKIKKTNKKQKNLVYKVISIVLAIVSALFIGILSYLDLIPTKYMTILTIIILVFDLFNIIFLNLKRLKKKVKKIISVVVIIAIIIMSIGSFYLYRTVGVLANNGDSKYKLEHYSVMVLKDSDYKNLNDLNNKTIGYYQNSTGSEEAQEYLNNKMNLNFDSYKDSNLLVSGLLKSEIDAILIEDSIKNILQEESRSSIESMKVLHTFTVKIKVESTLKEVDVTKESFAVYISGIDTYGQISSVSRSDVNIVMVINPTTKQILLITIPRDYYVQLHGTTGVKDKLTHAGIYGIDMSIKTIEDLLNVDINYYIKVNFTSVIDIVDALGGLDVYSDYSFVSYYGFNFKKGYNSVDGEQALDFVRTRKAFVDGDRQRGKNQQALIEAIVRKATNKSIITKYNSLLSAIDGKYQTNLGIKKITSLIKMQLEDMTSWNITSYSLDGSDSSNYTYTYNQLLYVMEPNESSVSEAISLINQVLDDEILESSYGDVSGSSNKVTKVPAQTNTSILGKPKDEENEDEIIDENESLKDDLPEETDEPKADNNLSDFEDDEQLEEDTSDKKQEESNPEKDEQNENDKEDNIEEEENTDSTSGNPSNLIIPTPEN